MRKRLMPIIAKEVFVEEKERTLLSKGDLGRAYSSDIFKPSHLSWQACLHAIQTQWREMNGFPPLRGSGLNCALFLHSNKSTLSFFCFFLSYFVPYRPSG